MNRFNYERMADDIVNAVEKAVQETGRSVADLFSDQSAIVDDLKSKGYPHRIAVLWVEECSGNWPIAGNKIGRIGTSFYRRVLLEYA